MTVIYAWNHVPDKQIQIGQEYAFVETAQNPSRSRVNPYRAKVLEVRTVQDKIEMNLKITKPDTNKRYSQEETITRTWPREDGNSATTLIYTNYETGSNNFPGNRLPLLFNSTEQD